MNSKEYRFSEIVTAVSLLEGFNHEEHDDFPTLPNFTDGLENMNLINALCVQSTKESDDWRLMFYASLLKSGMVHVMNEKTVTDADLNAFALAANIAWISKEGSSVLRALSILYTTTESCGADIPEFAYVVLDNPAGVAEWSASLDPYAILRGEKPEPPVTGR